MLMVGLIQWENVYVSRRDQCENRRRGKPPRESAAHTLLINVLSGHHYPKPTTFIRTMKSRPTRTQRLIALQKELMYARFSS